MSQTGSSRKTFDAFAGCLAAVNGRACWLLGRSGETARMVARAWVIRTAWATQGIVHGWWSTDKQ